MGARETDGDGDGDGDGDNDGGGNVCTQGVAAAVAAPAAENCEWLEYVLESDCVDDEAEESRY